MRSWLLCAMCASVVLLTACSRSQKPSESDARQQLADMIKEQSHGALSLVSFTKTDGLASVVSGVSVYALDFEATVRSSEDCIWLEANFPPALNFKVTRTPPTGDVFLFKTTNPGIEAKAGATFRAVGNIQFERTERAWRIVQIRQELVQATTPPDNPPSPARVDTMSLAQNPKDRIVGRWQISPRRTFSFRSDGTYVQSDDDKVRRYWGTYRVYDKDKLVFHPDGEPVPSAPNIIREISERLVLVSSIGEESDPWVRIAGPPEPPSEEELQARKPAAR